MVARVQEEKREWKVTVKRSRVSFWDDEDALELDSDGGGTTLRTY